MWLKQNRLYIFNWKMPAAARLASMKRLNYRTNSSIGSRNFSHRLLKSLSRKEVAITATECKGRELTEIADALKSISHSMDKLLETGHTNSTVPHAGNDCTRCFCATCANRATCKQKPDEILPGIYGSPCNGCGIGERFRPMEAPHCQKYIEEDTNAAPLQNFEHGACSR